MPGARHSNVQGDRTMGINEKPGAEFLAKLTEVFQFTPPSAPGHNTVQAIEAMLAGKSKVFIGLGAILLLQPQILTLRVKRCRVVS